MNRLIWIVGIVSGSSVDRLRYLHDQLVACFPDHDGGVSEETKTQLVSTGLKFARNEGERELETFVEIYRIMNKADVGPSGLDDMRWAIADCLYGEVELETKGGHDVELPEAPTEKIELEEAQTVAEPAIVSEGRKRSFEESEELFVPRHSRGRLESLCRNRSVYSTNSIGIRFLSKQNVALAQRGRWNDITKRMDLLSAVKHPYMVEMFCDTHRFINGKDPLLSITEDEANGVESSLYKGPFTERSLVDHLKPYIEWIRKEDLSRSEDELAERLMSTAKLRQFEALHKHLDLFRTSGLGDSLIGRVFSKAYRLLDSKKF